MPRLRQLVKTLIGLSGYYRLRYHAGTRDEKRLLVLMYHAIDEDGADAEALRPSVTRTQFAIQMSVLRRTCRVLPLRDAVAALYADLPLAQNAVAVTFDDGYGSVYERAFPILRRHGVPATVFLATGWVDGAFEPWWERLARNFEISSPEGLDRVRNAAGLPADGPPPVDLPGRRRLLSEIEGRIRPLHDERAQATVSRLVAILAEHARAPLAPAPHALDWERIAEMARHGVDFEAHTRMHSNLAASDPVSAGEEIEASKRDVETRLGRQVRGFAYPYGQLGDASRWAPVLRDLGFDYACTSHEGTNGRRSDRYLLRRGCLPNLDAAALQRRALYLSFAQAADGPLATAC